MVAVAVAVIFLASSFWLVLWTALLGARVLVTVLLPSQDPGVSNVPSKDPGLVLLPYATAFCEWLVVRAGKIATCVEVAAMILDYMVSNGFYPVSAARDNWLADDLLKRGQASASGATDSRAASEQMTRLGIPNHQYDATWFASHDFVPVVQEAIKTGRPVLFGLYAAHLLHDTWTNQNEDAGVNGHGITIVGIDSSGAICADPNTVQAKSGNFVHYTWADLKAAGGAYPSMVIPEVEMAYPIGIPHGWSDNKNGDVQDDTGTLTAPNGVPVVHGFRKFILQKGWDPENWPLAPNSYTEWDNGSIEPGNAAIGAGDRQDFRKASLGWTQAKGVYEIWVGQDLVALEQEVKSLKALLQQAQAAADAQTKLEAVKKDLSDLMAKL